MGRALAALGVLLVLILAALCLGGCAAEKEAVVREPLSPGGEAGSSPSSAGSGTAEKSAEAPAPGERAGVGDTTSEETWVTATPSAAAPAPEAKGSAGVSKAEAAASAPGAGAAGARPPAASGLRAGFADDNRQFNYFVQFLATYGPQVNHIPIPVDERIVLKVQDLQGRSLPNAEVAVQGQNGETLCRGLTYADGSYLFFPAEHGTDQRYRVAVTCNQVVQELELERSGPRQVAVAFPFDRALQQSTPLDLLFIVDTTGSMGEEIERLKATIEIINLNLTSLSSHPRVRFGMVLYKDRGDEYVTEVVPFTEDLQRFQGALDRVEAYGGGDNPEDLQAALEQALRMRWNAGGLRLAFVITDAPPHLDYGQRYTYVQAAREAVAKGIKIFGVGTGGLSLMGEVVLRQLAQYTSAKYIFLTYGESGESEGGAPGSVSHHTGENYQTDKLEAIIIRLAKEELAYVTDQPIEAEEEYFAARPVSDEAREQTLNKLFGMAVGQLIDYSAWRIPQGTPAAVLPLSPAQRELALPSEYFTEQLLLALSQDAALRSAFRLVERKDLQSLLQELELQLSDLADDKGAVRVGALMGAELLLAGRLYLRSDGFELFLKLLKVQTGEVLSVTKARIDRRLGPGT
jgi:Mg-chelatase subunit ChlD